MKAKSAIQLDEAWNALRAAAGKGGRACDGLELTGLTWQTARPVAPEAGCLLDALAPVVGDADCRVIGQLGQSLDGRIATESGHSHTINGPEALIHLHRLRALVDAVVVGVGTVVADRPRLTVRRVNGSNPVRVILDPCGRAPNSCSPLVDEDNAPRTLHVVSPDAKPGSAGRHVERVRIATGSNGIAPADLLEALKARGLRRVLIEGGADTLSRFIDAGALDRLHLLVAPMLMGSGRCGLRLRPIRTVDEALRPQVRRAELGHDTLFDVDLRG